MRGVIGVVGREKVRETKTRVPKLSVKQRRDAYEQLATLLGDNVELYDALTAMADRLAQGNKNDKRARVYRHWAQGLREGKPFSEAIAGTVSSTDATMLMAVERAKKNMAQGMSKTADLMEKTSMMQKAMSGFLFNFVYLAGMFMALVVVVVVKVIPGIGILMDEEQWTPGFAQLAWLSEFLLSPWAISIPLGAGLIAYGVWLAMNNWANEYRDSIGDKLPGFGVYRNYQGAVALYTVAMLTEANIELSDAFRVLRSNASPWTRRHVDRVLEALRSGEPPDQALDSGLFNKHLRDNIAIFAKAQDFRLALTNLGRRAIDDAVKAIDMSATTFRNVFMLALFGFMAYVYLTVSTMVNVATKSF